MENHGRVVTRQTLARQSVGLRFRRRAPNDQRAHSLAAREDRRRSVTRGTSSRCAAAATCSRPSLTRSLETNDHAWVGRCSRRWRAPLLTLLVTRALASRAANEPSRHRAFRSRVSVRRRIRSPRQGSSDRGHPGRPQPARGVRERLGRGDLRLRSGRVGGHIIEAIHSVEFEGRITEALRGEASVAPFELPRAARRAHVPRLRLSARRRGDAQRVVVFAEDQTDLVRLDRARKEFLSNVSHELRTPLSSIKLMIETVIESPDEEASDLFLPQALAQVDRLTVLVAAASRPNPRRVGALKLNLRDIDLEEVAASDRTRSNRKPRTKASPCSCCPRVRCASKPTPTASRKYSSI